MSRYLNPYEEIHKAEAGKLPHWQQDDVMQFVTFRLADSIPQSLLRSIKRERDEWVAHHPQPWSQAESSEYFELFHQKLDGVLDQGLGECCLRDPKVRAILEDVFMRGHGVVAALHAWVIMPNHVHLVFSPHEQIGTVIKAWKGASSHRIGRGAIWQKNYFDRMIRDRAHFQRVVRYIRRNPRGLELSQYSLWEGPLALSVG
ncbi:transposase [Sulfuriroseicoccus oceanibius]|uniref:Transposase n=1 Tax=Sulfuriroseicoccus oceanibius TaxID=2707525 RepID=A0A6B3LA98_9BACT|nr:transposase [Sulfuriroseicoccus oceanibius]QQL44810.1 transposase [Sulfuriroseicoccus oceanibius]